MLSVCTHCDLERSEDRSGAQGIDFFKKGDSGNAADDLSKGGAAVKFRLSSTTLTYGDQMPALPVLSYDNCACCRKATPAP